MDPVGCSEPDCTTGVEVVLEMVSGSALVTTK